MYCSLSLSLSSCEWDSPSHLRSFCLQVSTTHQRRSRNQEVISALCMVLTVSSKLLYIVILLYEAVRFWRLCLWGDPKCALSLCTYILTLSWAAGHICPTYKESFQVRWDNSIPLFLHAAIYLEVSLIRWTSQNAFSRETAVDKWYCAQCCIAERRIVHFETSGTYSDHGALKGYIPVIRTSQLIL